MTLIPDAPVPAWVNFLNLPFTSPQRNARFKNLYTMKFFFAVLASILVYHQTIAQRKKAEPMEKLKMEASGTIQSGYNDYKTIALTIWDYAEVGYKEFKSSALLQ